MYSSGKFAMMGNVGRKALRIYRDEGLLIPVLTNKENGYHYYDESQLATLETIKRLRSVGISLFEIRQILNGEADEKDIVKSRILEADELLKDMKAMISDPGKPVDEVQEIEPDIRAFPECTCLYIDENVELENLGMSVGKLYEKAAREGMRPAGSHFVCYDGLDDEAKFSMRTYLPVSDHTAADLAKVSEDRCLHINFKGGFSKVSGAHLLLHKYAEEHRIGLTGRAYEVYNGDMSVDVYYCL